MRMMLILFGASAFVYYVTGLRGRFTVRKRIYFAMGTYIIVYLITMILVFTVGNP